MSEIAQFLRTVPQLRLLDEVELTALSEAMSEVEYDEGAVIIEEGAHNHAFHILRSGRLRVCRIVEGREVALCDLSPGQTFGELSILGDQRTTATVRTVSPCRVLSLSMDDLDFVLRQSPVAAAMFWQALARDLRDRLVETNEVVRQYFEVNRALVDNPTFREAYAMCTR